MSGFSNYSGARFSSGSVVIPMYGTWAADLSFADASPIPANGTLTIGDLVLFGTVTGQLNFGGARSARLVGGYGAWRKTIGARAYANPNGVSLSTVIGDAAKDCGEQVKVTTDASVGAAYVREAAPASRTLRSLAGAMWWVDPTGVTRVGPRDSDGVAIDSVFEILAANGSDSRYTIATDTPAEWLPGRIFSGPTVTTPAKVSIAIHTVTGTGKGRVEVLAI